MMILPPPPGDPHSGTLSNLCITSTGGVDTDKIPEGVRKGMFIVEDWNRSRTQFTLDSLLNFLISSPSSRIAWLNELQGDSVLLNDYGFEYYLNEKYNSGTISSAFKENLIQIKSDFDIFLHMNHPSLEQTILFWKGKINSLSLFTGCEAEQTALLIFFQSAIGFAQYYYAANEWNASGLNSVEFRSCNFWQGLLCGTLSITIGVVTAAVVTVGSLFGIFSLEEDGVPFNCSVFGGDAPDELCAVIVGVLVGVTTGVLFYRWCCSWFGNGEEIVCREPQSYGFRTIACNQFEVSAHGAGNGAVSFIWENHNIEPATAITQSPFLTVSIPNPGQPSRLQATVLCSDGRTLTPEPHELLISSGSVGAIGWAIAPPAEATVGQSISVAVSAGIAFPQTLSWSASFGGGVSSTGTHTANVTFWASGAVTITATLTNACNGEPVSVSRTVIVKP